MGDFNKLMEAANNLLQGPRNASFIAILTLIHAMNAIFTPFSRHFHAIATLFSR